MGLDRAQDTVAQKYRQRVQVHRYRVPRVAEHVLVTVAVVAIVTERVADHSAVQVD